MAETVIDKSTWTRAEQFAFFRTFQRPHYAVTSRVDVTHLLALKAERGLSSYRACLFGIGAGIHGVPALRMRFRGDLVVLHDTVELSMTVPRPTGSFGYAYVPWLPDFAAFDAQARRLIEDVAAGNALAANTARDDMAYLSCLPWLDFTGLNNAMPGPDECIPRVSWGRFVRDGGQYSMAMTLEVHHALADGAHVGAFFTAVQGALDAL